MREYGFGNDQYESYLLEGLRNKYRKEDVNISKEELIKKLDNYYTFEHDFYEEHGMNGTEHYWIHIEEITCRRLHTLSCCLYYLTGNEKYNHHDKTRIEVADSMSAYIGTQRISWIYCFQKYDSLEGSSAIDDEIRTLGACISYLVNDE